MFLTSSFFSLIFLGGYSGPLLLDFSVGAVRPVSESAGTSQNVESLESHGMVRSHVSMDREATDACNGRKRILQCECRLVRRFGIMYL